MRKNHNENADASLFGLLPVIMLLTLAIIVLIFVGLPMLQTIDTYKDRLDYHTIDKFDKTYIESLESGHSIRGYFVLGSGSVNGKDVYIYYTKNADGGYIRNRVNADNTAIYMDENEFPYLISKYVETNRLHVQFINSYELHVPNGTITRTFDVMQ